MENKPVIIIGAGGHSKVLIDILKLTNVEILGLTDPKKEMALFDIKVLGEDEIIRNYPPEEIELVNGIGSIGNNYLRKSIFESFKKEGYRFRSVIHPSTTIASNVILSEGVQVMAGVVIQPSTTVGQNTIINTRSSIDHDNKIGSNVHIAPGVTLSGHVTIGDDVHVGTGANIIQNVEIKAGSTIGAGALVLKSVREYSKVIGVPCREVER
jgi:sugar O-acyltransferase (sialic acid O-acetyltransferase NeuD family)